MTTPLLADCLREESQAQHASVERALEQLVSPALTFGAYRRILGALLGFYEPLEAALRQVTGLPCASELRGREKAHRLRHDLRVLGASERALTAFPSCPRVPSVDGLSRALGCLYVLEGATLGGRVIARRLAEHLSIDARTGGAFFRGYGGETARMWSTFVARLNCQPPPFDHELAAASETFERLEGWLLARGAPTWQSEPAPPSNRVST